MSFSNADPKHAEVNPLRARVDRPHIWFEDGFWRVCPLPFGWTWNGPKLRMWEQAHWHACALNARRRA